MNKYSSFTLIMLLFCSSIVYGQTQRFQLGIEGGPNMKTLRGNDFHDDNELSIGYSAGFTFQYAFTDRVSLRTGISYEQKGMTKTVTAIDQFGNIEGDITLNSNFDYLIMPFLASFTFGQEVRFFLNVGPYFGYLLQQQDKLEAYKEFPASETDNKHHYDLLDYGFTTGLGLNLPIQERLRLSVELRNNLGLKSISSYVVGDNGTIQTNTTNILIGVAYSLGREID